MSETAIGRPRSELDAKKRRKLERLSLREAVALTKLTETRAELARAAQEALDDGASHRAIGEALGLPRTSVARFIRENSR